MQLLIIKTNSNLVSMNVLKCLNFFFFYDRKIEWVWVIGETWGFHAGQVKACCTASVGKWVFQLLERGMWFHLLPESQKVMYFDSCLVAAEVLS